MSFGFDRLTLALALSITLVSGCVLPTFVTAAIAKNESADSTKDKPKDNSGDKKDSKKEKADKKAVKEKEAQDLKDQKDAEKKAKDKEKDDEKKANDKKATKAEKESDKEKAKDGKDAAKAEVHAEVRKDAKHVEAKDNLKAEAKPAPAFVPDDALISVLKDINRALADTQTEQVAKIENVNQKMILGLAQEIFTKALTEPNVNANRILHKDDERQARTQLTAESWSSGDVEVSDKLRGSMAAVWAKRIGGLVTVTIAGDAGARKTPDGSPIGEFMVVLGAHSPVQKGFDIQSQGDVTFWMGKLNSITIEANCIPGEGDSGDKTEASSSTDSTSPSPNGSEAKKKSIASLSPLLTNRYRNHYAVLLAADIQSAKVLAEIAAAADADPADHMSAVGDDKKDQDSADEKDVAVVSEESTNGGKKEPPKADAKTEHDAKNKSQPQSKAHEQTKASAQNAKAVKAEKPEGSGEKISSAENAGDHNYMALASNTAGGATTVNGTATAAAVIETSRFHLPSINSTLLMPDKALAGQYVTVALLDRARQPEANVELSFNGASLTTDASGQAVYQIPEDTTPGRSLNIALSSRPDEIPSIIEVFQPLNITTGQAPRLDRISPLAVRSSVMTVEGHNFDGLAHNNSVIVDGTLEGKVISASPFQIKLLLPEGLTPGPHSLCISTDGMRSNLGGFDFADTQVSVDGKDNGKENAQIKLMIKVLGTTAKLNVRILNQTPDVVRLNRGAEMTVTSCGGYDNTVILPAVRGKKGPFKLDTQIEM